MHPKCRKNHFFQGLKKLTKNNWQLPEEEWVSLQFKLMKKIFYCKSVENVIKLFFKTHNCCRSQVMLRNSDLMHKIISTEI